MFKTPLTGPKSFGIPQLVTVCATIVLLYAAAAAQGVTDEKSFISRYSDLFTLILGAGAVGTILLNIVWGFFNRKKYDSLKETIDDQQEIIAAKELRNAELKLHCSEIEARLTLSIERKESTITGLKVSNGAVVSQNLQMKAILKGLRLSGKWDGHEDQIHQTQ